MFLFLFYFFLELVNLQKGNTYYCANRLIAGRVLCRAARGPNFVTAVHNHIFGPQKDRTIFLAQKFSGAAQPRITFRYGSTRWSGQSLSQRVVRVMWASGVMYPMKNLKLVPDKKSTRQAWGNRNNIILYVIVIVLVTITC